MVINLTELNDVNAKLDTVIKLLQSMSEKNTGEGSALSTFQQRFLTASELAGYLRVSKATIYRLTSTGGIPFRKYCGRLIFEQSEIDSWIKKENR